MTEQDPQPIIRPEEEASDEEFVAAMKAAEAASSVDEVALTSSSSITALDSLQANEFALELAGQVVPGVFRVEGLTSFKLEGGNVTHPPITIAKMVQRDATLPFSQWIQETMAAGRSADRPRRTLAVVAIDDGEETRRWTLSNATIIEITYTAFDTSSGDLVEEQVTVQFESITESWTWSDQQ